MKPRQPYRNTTDLLGMPLAVELIRFEKNLLQMGFFGAHDTRHSNQTTRRIEQFVNREGQKIKVAAEFRASQEFGLPSTSDRDKYIAFMRIAMNQKLKSGGSLENPIRFTGYQLLKELGLSFSGENYEDINRWGQRMVDTSISSEQVIYLAARKKYANKTVHVFRSFTRAGQSAQDGSNRTEAFEVVLEDWLLENLNQSYVVPEDVNAYRQLKRPTAKGIFGYLHLWFHASQGRDIEKAYSDLCVLLNIPAYKHVSKIKETMGRSLDELTSIRYLAQWEIKRMATKSGYKLVLAAGDELLRVLAVNHPKQISKELQVEESDDDLERDGLTRSLMNLGIRRGRAKVLTRTHGEERVRAAVDYTTALSSARKRSQIENPAGFIIYLLENGITLPLHPSAAENETQVRGRDKDQQDYQGFVDSELDNVIQANFPGKALSKHMKQLVAQRSEDDALFKSLPEQTQTILAHRIFRDEVAKELALPTLDEWVTQRKQVPLF